MSRLLLYWLALPHLSRLSIGYSTGSGTCSSDFASITGMERAIRSTDLEKIQITTDVPPEGYTGGSRYSILISASRGFEGFLLYAVHKFRSTEPELRVGKFLQVPQNSESLYRIKRCVAADDQTTITHSSSITKSAVQIVWVAPVENYEEIEFRGIGYAQSSFFPLLHTINATLLTSNPTDSPATLRTSSPTGSPATSNPTGSPSFSVLEDKLAASKNYADTYQSTTPSWVFAVSAVGVLAMLVSSTRAIFFDPENFNSDTLSKAERTHVDTSTNGPVMYGGIKETARLNISKYPWINQDLGVLGCISWLLRLGEELYSVESLDQEAFSFQYTLLVFGGHALLSIISEYIFRNSPLWGDVLAPAATEVIQAFMLVYLSSFSLAATVVFSSIGALQIFFFGLLYHFAAADRADFERLTSNNANLKIENFKGVRLGGTLKFAFLQFLILVIAAGMSSVSPFRAPSYDRVLTVFVWLSEFTLQEMLDAPYLKAWLACVEGEIPELKNILQEAQSLGKSNINLHMKKDVFCHPAVQHLCIKPLHGDLKGSLSEWRKYPKCEQHWEPLKSAKLFDAVLRSKQNSNSADGGEMKADKVAEQRTTEHPDNSQPPSVQPQSAPLASLRSLRTMISSRLLDSEDSPQVLCPAGHQCEFSTAPPKSLLKYAGFTCNECGNRYLDYTGGTFRCAACNYDLCPACKWAENHKEESPVDAISQDNLMQYWVDQTFKSLASHASDEPSDSGVSDDDLSQDEFEDQDKDAIELSEILSKIEAPAEILESLEKHGFHNDPEMLSIMENPTTVRKLTSLLENGEFTSDRDLSPDCARVFHKTKGMQDEAWVKLLKRWHVLQQFIRGRPLNVMELSSVLARHNQGSKASFLQMQIDAEINSFLEMLFPPKSLMLFPEENIKDVKKALDDGRAYLQIFVERLRLRQRPGLSILFFREIVWFGLWIWVENTI